MLASNAKLLNVKLSSLPDGPVIAQSHSVLGLYVYGKLGECMELVGTTTVLAQLVVTFTKNRLLTNVNDLINSPNQYNYRNVLLNARNYLRSFRR